MTRTTAVAAATLLAATLAQPALAVQDEDLDFDNTEDLYQVCSVRAADAEYVPASFACRGFIEAAVQYHDQVSNRKKMKRLICYPQGATVADARAAFVLWGERHLNDPERMDEAAVVGLVRALAAEYPCR